MKMSYAAVINLRSRSGGTDKTLYLSTHGNMLSADGSIRHFAPVLHLSGTITNEFGRARDAYQVPAHLLLTIDAAHQQFKDYLPNGSDPQYWEGATVTIYQADFATNGDAVTSLTTEFIGEIVRGTFHYSETLIEFDCFDIRQKSNKPILQQTWSDHAGYDATAAGVVDAGQKIPVVLGDWTGTAARIPARLIDVNGSTYVYAICNHACGTLTVYDADGNTITPSSTANFATRGEFSCTVAADADYDVGEELFVTCVGYPSSLTDANAVRLVQFILTQFGGVALASIYNDLSESTTNERGSFRELYEQTGGTSPEYPARAYISGGELAVNVAAAVAYESNARLAVVNNEWRIYLELPMLAENATTIKTRYLDSAQELVCDSDPNDEFCTVIRCQYDYNPSGDFAGLYDTSVEVTTGPIDSQRDRYRNDTTQTITTGDVVLDDEYRYVYGETAVATSVQRRLYWRIQVPQILRVPILTDEQAAPHYTLTLYNDFQMERGIWAEQYFRVLSISKNATSGSATVAGLSLQNLPNVGIWTDDDGKDAAGNVTPSYWGDADGLDSDDNPVGAWI